MIRRFLKLFWTALRRCFRRDETLDVVKPEELLSRFIFETRNYSAKEMRPKQKAFIPELHPELKRLETSVCRSETISEARIWHLGKTVRSKKVAVARADFRMQSINSDLGLTCVPVPEKNFSEHAVLIGWPEGDDAKAHRMSIAADLVYAAALKLPPSE